MNFLLNTILYALLKLISYFPFWIIYRISDLLYPLMYYVIRYRKKVVFENLNLAFPEKTKKEKILIAKKFYRHFCDLLLEVIKTFSISKKELLKRLRYTNPECLYEEYEKKRIFWLFSHIIIIGNGA